MSTHCSNFGIDLSFIQTESGKAGQQQSRSDLNPGMRFALAKVEFRAALSDSGLAFPFHTRARLHPSVLPTENFREQHLLRQCGGGAREAVGKQHAQGGERAERGRGEEREERGRREGGGEAGRVTRGLLCS
eukprot:2884232-Rhodomonas_salina.1